MCGLETVDVATSGAYSLTKTKDDSQGSATSYVMTESEMEDLFTIDTSATDAHAGCKAETYELVEADETTAYNDTTYVQYTAGTGLTWYIHTEVTNQTIYLKMTTIGGASKVKQIDFTVLPDCGSETI